MSTIGNPKIQRAIDCISAVPAEKLGHSTIIRGSEPCCALGHLLVCAGVSVQEMRNRRADGISFTEHPELDEVYGIGQLTAWDISGANDKAEDSKRKEVVLSFLRSLL